MRHIIGETVNIIKIETAEEREKKLEEREKELFEKRCKNFKALPYGVYMVNPKTIVAEVPNASSGEEVIDNLPYKLKKKLDKGKRKLYSLQGYESHYAIILNRLPSRLGSLTDAGDIRYGTYKLNVPFKCTIIFALDH